LNNNNQPALQKMSVDEEIIKDNEDTNSCARGSSEVVVVTIVITTVFHNYPQKQCYES
jgi:hypothetical protein